MTIPYLLMVYNTVSKSAQTIDVQKLQNYINEIDKNIQSLQEEVDGRFSKGITMLTNSRDSLRVGIGKVNSCVQGIKS